MIDNKIKDTYKILTSIQDNKTPLYKHFKTLNTFRVALMTLQDLYNNDIAYTFIEEVKDFYNLQGFKTSSDNDNINYIIQV
jgi:hypothetical protein